MTSLKHFIIFLIFLSLTKTYFTSCYERKVQLYLKSIKCTHDPAMFNGTVDCSIKPFRNKTQLATALYTFRKPCNDLSVNVVVYFKFGGTASYRQWLINFDENVCEVFKGDSYPSLLSRIVYDAFERIAPNVIHKCPYVGEEGVRNINVDQVLAGIVPHVIPTGDYRILFRFHTTSNKTFLSVMFGGYIIAHNPLETVAMG